MSNLCKYITVHAVPAGQAYLPTHDLLIVVEGSLLYHHGAKVATGGTRGMGKKGPAATGSLAVKPVDGDAGATLGPGAVLNWQSLLLDWANLATTPLLRPRRLVATTDSVLWSVPIQRFAEVTARYPKFGLQVIGTWPRRSRPQIPTVGMHLTCDSVPSFVGEGEGIHFP